MIVDTHTHLYLPEFDMDRDEVMGRAMASGVGKLIFPNVDLSTVGPMRDLHSRYPDSTFMAIGLHPTEVNEDYREGLKVVENELVDHRPDFIAVGEIGIDLYWDKTYIRQQIEAFAIQSELASRHNLPIIIHCREGLDETLDVLRNMDNAVSGVFHSFGGTAKDVSKIRETGDFYFGINGIVTFRNSGLRDVLGEIGLDRILLETDAPYLAPVPYRGKRNESAYIVNTARVVAESLGVSLEEVEEQTTLNASRLFGI